MTQLTIDIALIDIDPHNPRGKITDVSDLVASMRVRGQEDPVQLIPKEGGRFWLHEGHRRRLALLELEQTTIWYIERQPFPTERDRLLSQGTLHLHRVDFDPIAWADYLHNLYWHHNMSRVDLAHHLGRSARWVRDTMSLTHLQPHEKAEITAGKLTKGEALWRLGNRRAVLTGSAPPAPAPKKAHRRDQHFSTKHPLARAVKRRCVASGEDHCDRPRIGEVGCGECWEQEIRADAVQNAARSTTMALAA